MTDINRATQVDADAVDLVQDMFEYHTWDEDQQAAGKQVREALMQAVLQIVRYVPPCPDRSVAIRKLREARMDCNSAITHKGRY